MKILVTGAKGFLGRHLVLTLKERYHEVYEYDINCGDLNELTKDCEIVFHLAGVTRPEDGDFSPNIKVLNDLLDNLILNKNKCPIIFSSSIWATTDTPYGISKRETEDILNKYGEEYGVETYVYRLCNVFGPGARNNYCSVVSTWCHNLSHNAECRIDDVDRKITFLYIDDLIESFLTFVDRGEIVAPPVTATTLGDTYNALLQIKDSVEQGLIPNNESRFMSQLYSTYLYHMGYPLLGKEMQDNSPTELFKLGDSNSILVDVMKPGDVKRNTYYNSKWEQIIVLKGRCKIIENNIFTGQEKSYSLDEFELRSIYIKPLHFHSITNVGTTDAVVLIYSNDALE